MLYHIVYDIPSNKIGGIVMPKMDEGWYQSKSGNWYNKSVCRGLAAHCKTLCSYCGKMFFVRKHRGQDTGKRVYCSTSCKQKVTVSMQDLSHLKKYEFKKGQIPYNYKGGSIRKDGRKVVTGNGERCFEYRKIIEQFLGRKLKANEVIHHENGDVTDNRIENLRLMTQSEHTKLHWERGSYDNRNM